MAKLDFSQFHATGDHWPFTSYCRTFYGGGFHHLKLAWTYRRRDQIIRPFARMFKCSFKKHSWQVWYTWNADGEQKCIPMCKYCPASRLPSEDEALNPPNFPEFT